MEVEYDTLFLPFWYGLTLAMEEAKERKVNMGIGRGVKMANNQEFQHDLADGAQVFDEMVA